MPKWDGVFIVHHKWSGDSAVSSQISALEYQKVHWNVGCFSEICAETNNLRLSDHSLVIMLVFEMAVHSDIIISKRRDADSGVT